MNRRNFLSTLGAAVTGFTILPPATTYSRIWKATYRPSSVGIWEQLQACQSIEHPLPLDLDAMLALLFQIARNREPSEKIEIIVPAASVDWIRSL